MIPKMMILQFTLQFLQRNCQKLCFKTTQRALSKLWSSKDARSVFLKFFEERGHQIVPSSPVIPDIAQGTYFVNAGMNQFKPLFLGIADQRSAMASYRRVANSQKCIRVGGKHNDLSEVGKDRTHHTFFEMLGTWSFGDYFKVDACKMALELLTSVYNLPMDCLYFTYFGGDDENGLAADLECRDIWLSLGVASERILPFGMRDNFWDMGDTGPCGPCTEIHFDYNGPVSRKHLVNSGHPDVVELWNIVFMQYQRHRDDTLSQLSRHHVDTGMGLERLLGVLNGTGSNYDSDLFRPIFQTIQKVSGCESYGRPSVVGNVDVAYRVLADHARMFTVAIADGLLPSNMDVGKKMRQLMFRCIRLSKQTFRSDPHVMLMALVDCVVLSLGDVFSEVAKNKDLVKGATQLVVDGYLRHELESRAVFRKVLRDLTVTHLTGDVVWGLFVGQYGTTVPVEMIVDLGEEFDVTVDTTGFSERLRRSNIKQSVLPVVEKLLLTEDCYNSLLASGVTVTDDGPKYFYRSSPSGYDFSSMRSLQCKVVGLVQRQGVTDMILDDGHPAAVILNQTCFYSEAGGQQADTGLLTFPGGEFAVDSVRSFNGLVLHYGQLISGQLRCGHVVKPTIKEADRLGCIRSHTACHLMGSAIQRCLKIPLARQGSSVGPDRLRVNVVCLKKPSILQIKEIESIVRKSISSCHQVLRQDMPFSEAQHIGDLIYSTKEDYPSVVTVVRVTDENRCSVSCELCCGTHVDNTDHIGDFCITRVSSVSQGVYRVTGITGPPAVEAHKNGGHTMMLCEEFSSSVKSGDFPALQMKDKSRHIRQLLENWTLPLHARAHVTHVIESLGPVLSTALHKHMQIELLGMVEQVVHTNLDAPYLLHFATFDEKQMVKAVKGLQTSRPIALVSTKRDVTLAVMVFPKDVGDSDVEMTMRHLIGCEGSGGKVKSTVNSHGCAVMQTKVCGPNTTERLHATLTKLVARNTVVSAEVRTDR